MQSFLAPIMLACLTGPAAAANPPHLIGGGASKDRLELGNRVIRYVLQTDTDHAGPLAQGKKALLPESVRGFPAKNVLKANSAGPVSGTEHPSHVAQFRHVGILK